MNMPQPKPGILDIAPYVGGKSKLDGNANPIKLSSNENAFGCAPSAREAYEAAKGQLFRYPDGHANLLRAAVAAHHNLEPERLLFGNGSDEVFALLNQTYLSPGDSVISGQYGFLAYRISALACEARLIMVPEPERQLEVEAILSHLDDRTRLVYVSNPANPTGTCLSPDEVARLHAGLPSHVILVIDEAYAEFAAAPEWGTALDLARAAQNLVVTRTFSKIYGLAGLRVGFGYAPRAVVEAIDRICLPFNLNLPAQFAAVAALDDQDHVERSRLQVETWRPRLVQTVRGMGLDIHAGQGNFVLIDFGSVERAVLANQHLMKHGVIVRHLAAYDLPQALRVTIGQDPEMAIFLEVLGQFAP